MFIGFLRLSGSKRGSVCFGQIWRFPAPYASGCQPQEWTVCTLTWKGARPLDARVLEEFIDPSFCFAEPRRVSCRTRSLAVWRGGFRCRLPKCPGGNASSVRRWLFSSFKKDFSTRIVMETTLGLFMDHKDYGGTNFAIPFFFSKSKNHGSAVCS